jgi:two-component system LytT family response regulator
VKSNGHTYIFDTPQIDWCEAHGNYVELHVNQESYLVRSTITRLEATLTRYDFIRVHRSTLVKSTRVCRMYPAPDGDYILMLRDGTHCASRHRTESASEIALHVSGVCGDRLVSAMGYISPVRAVASMVCDG